MSPLAFTAWQLMAGGLLRWPVAWLWAPLPAPTVVNVLGLVWLGLAGAALTYILWLRGIARLGPSAVAPLGFLSPLAAVLLGWVYLDQSLDALQMVGVALVIGSIWLSQYANGNRSG